MHLIMTTLELGMKLVACTGESAREAVRPARATINRMSFFTMLY